MNKSNPPHAQEQPDLPNTFGQKLKAWREAREISGWKIEKRTGIPRQNLSNIENGKRSPSEDVIQKLAALPELQLTENTLRAWIAIDTFGQDVLLEALKELTKSYHQQDLRKQSASKLKASQAEDDSAP